MLCHACCREAIATVLNAIIDFLNTIFWGYVLIYGLIAVGIYFTLRLGFIQFRHFPELFRSVMQAPASDASGITPLQALCTSLASRVGTGNLAGVAVAIFLGGLGALFWMWVVAASAWRPPIPKAHSSSSTRLPTMTDNIAAGRLSIFPAG